VLNLLWMSPKELRGGFVIETGATGIVATAVVVETKDPDEFRNLVVGFSYHFVVRAYTGGALLYWSRRATEFVVSTKTKRKKEKQRILVSATG